MKLSYIICTRNRVTTLQKSIDATCDAIRFAALSEAELIVVDNGSSDGTAAFLSQFSARAPMPVQILFQPRTGLSAARNLAFEHARGDIVAFIDDDCCMYERHTLDLLRYDAQDRKLTLRGGGVQLGSSQDLPLTILESSVARTWRPEDAVTKKENLANAILGCNTAMRRELIELIGPFDEDLGPGSRLHAGEDPDFVYRAYLAGADIAYVPDMLVYHHHGRRTQSQGRDLLTKYSIGAGAVYAKFFTRHPDFCRQFVWDVKDAAKDLISRRNSFRPDLDFSHLDKLVYSIYGAAMYATRPKRSGGSSALPD